MGLRSQPHSSAAGVCLSENSLNHASLEGGPALCPVAGTVRLPLSKAGWLWVRCSPEAPVSRSPRMSLPLGFMKLESRVCHSRASDLLLETAQRVIPPSRSPLDAFLLPHGGEPGLHTARAQGSLAQPLSLALVAAQAARAEVSPCCSGGPELGCSGCTGRAPWGREQASLLLEPQSSVQGPAHGHSFSPR